MNDAPPRLTKLPGRSLGWTGRARLWLAEDHVLEVSSTFVAERYRRFFLHDIRAVIIRSTAMRRIAAIIHGIIGGGSALVAGVLWWAGSANEVDEFRITLWILAGMIGVVAVFFLALFAINLLRGPSCRVHVFTTAGLQQLAAPTRLGPARRLVAQLTPLIEAAQTARAAEPAPTEFSSPS